MKLIIETRGPEDRSFRSFAMRSPSAADERISCGWRRKNVRAARAALAREGHYYIEDLKQLTGIRVNGEKVEGSARPRGT